MVKAISRNMMVLATVVLAGCLTRDGGRLVGSGKVVTVREDFSDFTKVVVTGAFRATVRCDDRYSVAIHTDDNLVPYLRVRQEDGTLVIEMEQDHSFREATMEAEITMPRLDVIQASGATHVVLSDFRSETHLDVGLSGVSALRGEIEVASLAVDASGSSRLILSGAASSLRIDASGSCRVLLAEFPVRDARVAMSGAGQAAVNVSDALSVTASGASILRYQGSPVIERTLSGTARLRPL